MAEDRKDNNGKEHRETLTFLTRLFSFLETLPGIITGVVALIAAIASIFRVTQGHFPFTPSPGRSQSAVTTTAAPSATQGSVPHGTQGSVPHGTQGSVPHGTQGSVPHGTATKPLTPAEQPTQDG